MAGIIKARARFVGDTNSKFINNTFHDIKIKQDAWKVIIKLDSDIDNTTKTDYDDLDTFLNNWDICCRINHKG